MSDKLVLAVPSKGRLMDQTSEALARAGLTIRKTGSERGYRGEVEGMADVDVAFVSSSDIATQLKNGQAHLGITGEDLIREHIIGADGRVEILARLGFGRADVVVAVPDCWIDVRRVGDLQAIAGSFRRRHGRRLRVATKYMNLTRRFLVANGVSDYRLVESLGATEGAPAAGAADLIVDITTTGATLEANALRVLDDGVILKSEACLVSSRAAVWTPPVRAVQQRIAACF
jgi:ATP phosphoribosyltransferase